MKIIIIAAIAKNGVIGSGLNIPWHSSEDFKHFKATTLKFPVLMGLNTFKSLGKPLPNRLNIVVAFDNFVAEDYGAEVVAQYKNKNLLSFKNINEAIEYCKKEDYEKLFIIGGGSIYAQTIIIADEMILSMMNFDAEGDVFFPDIELVSEDLSTGTWRIVKEEPRENFVIKYYKRKNY